MWLCPVFSVFGHLVGMLMTTGGAMIGLVLGISEFGDSSRLTYDFRGDSTPCTFRCCCFIFGLMLAWAMYLMNTHKQTALCGLLPDLGSDVITR